MHAILLEDGEWIFHNNKSLGETCVLAADRRTVGQLLVFGSDIVNQSNRTNARWKSFRSFGSWRSKYHWGEWGIAILTAFLLRLWHDSPLHKAAVHRFAALGFRAIEWMIWIETCGSVTEKLVLYYDARTVCKRWYDVSAPRLGENFRNMHAWCGKKGKTGPGNEMHGRGKNCREQHWTDQGKQGFPGRTKSCEWFITFCNC